jgi:hypothetical protein
LKKAATETLPTVSFKKHLKPYWNSRLTELHDAMLEYRQRWILDGRPRGCEHQSFANYKSAKYMFRDELRKANKNYEINASNLIEDSLEFDKKNCLVFDKLYTISQK